MHTVPLPYFSFFRRRRVRRFQVRGPTAAPVATLFKLFPILIEEGPSCLLAIALVATTFNLFPIRIDKGPRVY